MPENKKSLLDSFAMLAFLNKESGFEKVRSLLRQAEGSNEPLVMNEINIGEVYYITARTRSLDLAEDFLNRLETLPLQIVTISYADAFAVATAIRMNAAIVTGDPEFRRVEQLVTVNWL